MDPKREKHLVKEIAKLQVDYDDIKGKVEALKQNPKVNERALQIQGRRLQSLNRKLEQKFESVMEEMNRENKNKEDNVTKMVEIYNKIRKEGATYVGL
jgi:hypothetical protein